MKMEEINLHIHTFIFFPLKSYKYEIHRNRKIEEFNFQELQVICNVT